MTKIIDFHSHILPGMDHGSPDIETAAAQLKLIERFETDFVVATSHFYPHAEKIDRFLARRERARGDLEKIRSGKLGILIGAEALVCENMVKMPRLEELCIENTNVLLLEMPFGRLDKKIFDSIEEIGKKGFKIVLAHVDRYDKEDIEMLFALGFSGQLNAHALASYSLDTVISRKRYFEWIDKGYIAAFGSDLHGADSRGYAKFVKAVEIAGERGMIVMERSAELLFGRS